MTFPIVERLRKLGVLFVIFVIFPTVCAVVYYGFLASDVYVSESRFVVRTPEKSMPTGLGLLFRTTGIGGTADENSAAQSYVTSRDALAALDAGGAIRKSFTSPTISVFDRFDPFGTDGSFEKFFRYFERHISVDHESSSTITVLTVRAYTADDAYRINRGLLEQSESLVNRLSTRARNDVLQLARMNVQEAQRQSARSAAMLSEYRNRAGVVDPERQAQVQLQMISKLQDTLIATQTQLSELRVFTPRNPQIEVLQQRVRELGRQISEQAGLVAGNQSSLSSKAARFQRLQLESQFADKQLAAALASLQEAQNEAERKQAYVERIVQPSHPDKAMEPRRLRGIAITMILGLVAWGVISMLIAGIREHGA